MKKDQLTIFFWFYAIGHLDELFDINKYNENGYVNLKKAEIEGLSAELMITMIINWMK